MKFDPKIVRQWVAGVLAGIYAPEPDEEIWEWAERTLRIPSTENEEMAGMFWSAKLTPYVKDLLKWARQPGKGEFWIKKSSQVGFTMAVLILICWMIVHRPGNIIYAIDSITEARNISKTRLRKWIENNKLLEGIGENEDDLSNLTYYLRGMTVYMLGAHSKGGWANKSVVLCILDELDKHPYIEGEGTTVTLARERLKRPKNAKLIGFSTPGDGDQITTEYDRGTKEEIRIPFPCCGHYQALHWKNLIFSTKEFKDLADGYDREKIETSAYFKCELCGGRLYDSQKNAALQLQQHHRTAEKATGRIRSLHIWDAYSPFVTFGQLALEWIDSAGDETLLERFFRGRLGEKFTQDGANIKTADLLKCRGTYNRGEIPVEPIFVGAVMDIQKEIQKSIKFAMDAAGNMFITDWFISLSEQEGVDWFHEPVRCIADTKEYTVQGGVIDEGHRTDDIRLLCYNRHPEFGFGIWPIKGRASNQVRETIGTSTQHIAQVGDDILTYHIAEDQFKWRLLYMIRDHEKRAKKNEIRIFFPMDMDCDDDFMDEMIAERPVKEKDRRGRDLWVWKKKKDDPNDFWDCAKYGLALRDIMFAQLCPEPQRQVRHYQLHARPAEL